MQHAASYQDLHDWEAERASIRETVVESRHTALRNNRDAVELARDAILEEPRLLIEGLATLDWFALLHGKAPARVELEAVACTLVDEALKARADAELPQ